MPSPEFESQAENVAEAIENGTSIADAARQVGVSPRTVERWLARGRSDPQGPYYGAFAARVDGARAERELPPSHELPLDDAELRALVARAARKGSVRAMELAAKLLGADGADEDVDARARRMLAPLIGGKP